MEMENVETLKILNMNKSLHKNRKSFESSIKTQQNF
jgi:hypothetical protein